MALAALAHAATECRAIRQAAPLRRICAFEQFIHACLIVLPTAALVIVVVLNRPAFTALLALTGAPRGAVAGAIPCSTPE